MKPSPNLSFSVDENRVDYHYIPEAQYPLHPLIDSLNLGHAYDRSLSSSFLPMPQFQMSINSSLSFDYEQQKQSRSREKETKDEVKVENYTKVEFQPASFVDLGLEYLVPNKKFSTKNVLRNFGNAQNQYILHNWHVQQQLEQMIGDKKQFQNWLRKLKLLNFEDYQKAWTSSATDSKKQKLFKKIYRKFCWSFYKQQCIPYIFNSRLTPENKKSHLLQIYKLLNGIVNPTRFQGFKQ